MLLLALIACLGACFFFSGSETAIISVNRYRLRGRREQGDPDAERLLRLLDNVQRLMIVMLIGASAANVLAALIFKLLLQRVIAHDAPVLWGMHWSELLSLALLTPIIIIFAEILPKALFRAHADALVGRLRLAYVACAWLFWPVVWVVEHVTRLMLGPLAEARSRAYRHLSRRDVMQLIKPEERPTNGANGTHGDHAKAEEGMGAPRDATPTPGSLAVPARAGAVAGHAGTSAKVAASVAPNIKAQVERAFEANDERRMIENILTLHQTTAEEIMTPLVNVAAVQLGRVDMEGLRALAVESGYSRMPVYRDRIVHLIGHIDIFRVLREHDGRQPLSDFVERPHYVPETKRVDDLLQEFLDLRIKNAIVVDEHGGCSGWISREDILEEIVGELEDELDEPKTPLVATAHGVYVIDGEMEVDPLNEALGAKFSDENWETLAGLLLDVMGRIPKAGDEVTIDGWRARVLEMDGQRIARVELREPSNRTINPR
jgi:CBS domain containing-hemolysin-like protein